MKVLLLLAFILFAWSADHAMAAWGDNDHYQTLEKLDDGSVENPNPLAGVDKKLSCVMQNNMVYVDKNNNIYMTGHHDMIYGKTEDQEKLAMPTLVHTSTVEIVDLQCHYKFFMFLKSSGTLFGYGVNLRQMLSTTTYAEDALTHEAVTIRTNVEAFGLSNKEDKPGLHVKTRTNEIYYKGHNEDGAPCKSIIQETAFEECMGGVLTTENIQNITKLRGGYRTMYYITTDGRVFFAGKSAYAGMGVVTPDDKVELNPIELDFSSYIEGGKTSELAGKKVVDIACGSRDDHHICVALTESGEVFSWNDGTADDSFLGRTTTGSSDRVGNIAGKVSINKNVINIHASAMTFFLVTNDHIVYGFGSNNKHEITNLSVDHYTSPTQASTIGKRNNVVVNGLHYASGPGYNGIAMIGFDCQNSSHTKEYSVTENKIYCSFACPETDKAFEYDTLTCACAPGYGTTDSGLTCTMCEEGYFKSKATNAVCSKCSALYTNTDGDRTACNVMTPTGIVVAVVAVSVSVVVIFVIVIIVIIALVLFFLKGKGGFDVEMN